MGFAALYPSYHSADLGHFSIPRGGSVRLLLTRIAREHALPFDPLIPNAETIETMKEARQGKLASFDSVEALMADLNVDD